MFLSCIAINRDVNIHYLDSLQLSDHRLAPVIICPGLSETAEEYEDLLTYLLPRRGIVLSFRGRGRSDTPSTNYDLIDHIGDLEAVIQETKVNRFHLYGNSRGVSYALGYAQINQGRVCSLVVQDYPAEHKQMSAEWAEDYINNYLIPTGRNKLIRQQAVRSIQRESTAIQLDEKLELPILVIRGLLDGSLVSNTDLINYRNYYRNLKVCEFPQSSHNIRTTEKDDLYSAIKRFLDDTE